MIMKLMSSLRPFVRKSKEYYVRKTRQIRPEKMMEKRQKRGKKGHSWKKKKKVKKMGETDDSGYHRAQENVSHKKSQIVFALVGMEQSSVSSWWII